MKQQLPDFQRWLVDQRHVDDGGDAFAEALAEKLKQLGFPLWRQSFTLNTMHPEVLWRTMVWTGCVSPAC